ncbi:efflux RND transporter periplasmic adaptor subunit [Streptomyces sp. NPDC004726]
MSGAGEGTGATAGEGVAAGAGTTDPATAPARGSRRRRRRGRKVAVALAVLAAGGAVAATTLGLGGDGDSADGKAADGLPPNTTEVTKQSLEDVETTDGELGYGPSTDVSSRLGGTVTGIPETGQRVTRGKPLFEVDNRPVTLMYGSLPAYRALAEGVEGPDVKQLEQNLRALGYTGFTVDEEFTDATADAVREWQEDIGLEETGTVDLGRVVFAPAEVRVDALEAVKGSAVQMGAKLLSYTGTSKAVTVELDAADQRLAKVGRAVTVTLPDDTVVDGVINKVSTIIKPAGGQDEEASTKVEVVVGLKDKKAQQAAEPYALAAVNVNFTAETREDVLTVPVAALLALSEGGFGLEVVEGTTTSYVPVKTGLFADGRVEISGDGVSEGTIVGMPK